MSAIGVNCRIGSERHRLNLQDGHSFCDNAAAAMPYRLQQYWLACYKLQATLIMIIFYSSRSDSNNIVIKKRNKE